MPNTYIMKKKEIKSYVIPLITNILDYGTKVFIIIINGLILL